MDRSCELGRQAEKGGERRQQRGGASGALSECVHLSTHEHNPVKDLYTSKPPRERQGLPLIRVWDADGVQKIPAAGSVLLQEACPTMETPCQD